jgi:hypothetical protein
VSRQKGKTMSDKMKFTDSTRTFLRDAYVDAVTEFGGEAKVTKTFNDEFFAKMQRTEALEGFTVPQLRGSLIIADVYVATAPRAEPKKKGVTKKDLLATFAELSGVELSSGMKLTIADIEALIDAWPVEKEEVEPE